MPELPEIEHLRRTLQPHLLGRLVLDVQLQRQDVLRSALPNVKEALLVGQRIVALERLGKQLALVGSEGSVLCVHLGMSGQMRLVRPQEPFEALKHVHCTWMIQTSDGCKQLIFRDPRRFGGLWAFDSMEQLREQRWSRLGPDALHIRASEFRRALQGRKRPIKTALLDQAIIAGIGNIYADESLFDAGISPLMPAHLLTAEELKRLPRSIRKVLQRAVDAGGSTLRDYADANGSAGWFKVKHKVYGKGHEPCTKCMSPLSVVQLAQRTTVYCSTCQALPPQVIHNVDKSESV